jgi:hypothetical protein
MTLSILVIGAWTMMSNTLMLSSWKPKVIISYRHTKPSAR